MDDNEFVNENDKDRDVLSDSQYVLTEEQRKKIIEFGGCIEERPSLWQRIIDKLGL